MIIDQVTPPHGKKWPLSTGRLWENCDSSAANSQQLGTSAALDAFSTVY